MSGTGATVFRAQRAQGGGASVLKMLCGERTQAGVDLKDARLMRATAGETGAGSLSVSVSGPAGFVRPAGVDAPVEGKRKRDEKRPDAGEGGAKKDRKKKKNKEPDVREEDSNSSL